MLVKLLNRVFAVYCLNVEPLNACRRVKSPFEISQDRVFTRVMISKNLDNKLVFSYDSKGAVRQLKETG